MNICRTKTKQKIDKIKLYIISIFIDLALRISEGTRYQDRKLHPCIKVHIVANKRHEESPADKNLVLDKLAKVRIQLPMMSWLGIPVGNI